MPSLSLPPYSGHFIAGTYPAFAGKMFGSSFPFSLTSIVSLMYGYRNKAKVRFFPSISYEQLIVPYRPHSSPTVTAVHWMNIISLTSGLWLVSIYVTIACTLG